MGNGGGKIVGGGAAPPANLYGENPIPKSNGPKGTRSSTDSVLAPSKPSYCRPVPKSHRLFPMAKVPTGVWAVAQNMVHLPSLKALSTPG